MPKTAWESIAVESQGVQGDYHAGPTNRHKKSGEPEPNWRQVTLVAQEVLDDLNIRLGTTLKAGDLGENILLAGLGDLSQLSKGDGLRLGADVVLEVTAQNRPCDAIRAYHPTLVEEITGKRGIAAVVVGSGVLRPNDSCRILFAASEPA